MLLGLCNATKGSKSLFKKPACTLVNRQERAFDSLTRPTSHEQHSNTPTHLHIKASKISLQNPLFLISSAT